MKHRISWRCPKCKTLNHYYTEGIGILAGTVIGKPKCKKCKLDRFSNKYYLLTKEGGNE